VLREARSISRCWSDNSVNERGVGPRRRKGPGKRGRGSKKIVLETTRPHFDSFTALFFKHEKEKAFRTTHQGKRKGIEVTKGKLYTLIRREGQGRYCAIGNLSEKKATNCRPEKMRRKKVQRGEIPETKRGKVRGTSGTVSKTILFKRGQRLESWAADQETPGLSKTRNGRKKGKKNFNIEQKPPPFKRRRSL